MDTKIKAIRAFIAIKLPDEIRQKLDEIEKEIQMRAGESAHKAVRWVPASNMHLTLKFLGEVSAGNLQTLSGMVQNEAARHAAFEFRIAGLGAFPNIRRPRVIWVGAEAHTRLTALQKAIESGANSLGYPPEERPYSPHLTLGRISQNARPEEIAQVARALQEVKVGELGTVRVNCINLFHSDLRPSGAVYTVLREFPLKDQ